MRLRETVNECGTPVVEYRCETCGDTFTVCPAPPSEDDDQWTGCQATICASYEPDRDADKFFDDGNVASMAQRRGQVIRRPANAPRSWTKDDDWLVCACGSFAFNVMKRGGLSHVLCAKCETDHTVNVWEPE